MTGPEGDPKFFEDEEKFKCMMEHKSGPKVPRCKKQCISCEIWAGKREKNEE